MNDGIITLDSNNAKLFGFTSDKFGGWLWKSGNEIWISFIESYDQGKGNLRTLFDKIIESGYRIVVPNPFSRMEMICKQYGMEEETRRSEMGIIECMVTN